MMIHRITRYHVCSFLVWLHCGGILVSNECLTEADVNPELLRSAKEFCLQMFEEEPEKAQMGDLLC